MIHESNCAVREYTADGVPVGRCWHFVRDGQCPRHGNVIAVQRRYTETGKLTNEMELRMSNDSNNKHNVYKVLGRNIGVASGWDTADRLVIVLYDFIPMRGINIPPSSHLYIDFVEGLFKIYNDEGVITDEIDILSVLGGLV